MSILGYSSSYFLPQYWANTPLYGEKLLPLIDYILSNDYEYSESLAQAFYNIENKYKNIQDLPIDVIQEIIDENGYSYVRALLGDDEDRLRLLVSIVGLVHQLKGTKLGIEVVLNLLRRSNDIVTMKVVGTPTIRDNTYVTNFSLDDYVIFEGFTASGTDINVRYSFGVQNFNAIQTVISVGTYGLYVGVDTQGHFILSLGSNRKEWDIAEDVKSTRTITLGTEYYVRLLYDGLEYSLQVSTDSKTYETWISVESTKSLNIYGGFLYLGIDASEGTLKDPLSGYINFSDFSVGSNNIEITQWFEQTPVGPENTFIIKTDLDTELVSSGFFENFSEFVRNYVYPSLTAFTANLQFPSSLTILPYVRQKVIYNAMADVTKRDFFLVKTTEQSAEATDPFIVKTDEPFMVITG